jgi:hypothetical protein
MTKSWTKEQLVVAMQKSSEPISELMTEDELIVYLRIPEVSKSKDYHNVIENLKRMQQLPRIHICGKPLYPQGAIREWIKGKTTNGK